jgi:hypothetical protein
MKNIVLIFSFLIIFQAGKTQTWCPSGATWYYDIVYNNCDGFYKFEYVGDSTINTIACKKIIQSSKMKCWWDSYYQDYILDTFYMYADTDKVFYYRNNQFNLLYDFSVQTGDTMYITGITQSWWGNSCDSVAKLVVDSTGTMIINSESLRYYSVHPLSGSPFSIQGRIVEKIGPFLKYPFMNGTYGTNYFLPVKNDYCGMLMEEEAENGSFRCYYDDNFPTISLTQYSCDYTLATSENEFQSVYLYPNPAHDFIYFSNHSDLQNSEIEVFGMDGKMVKKSMISDRLFTGDLAAGFYYLRFISSKNIRETIKISVLH